MNVKITVFFFTSENRNFFLSRMFTLFASDRIKFPWREKLKNWFLGQNNIYTSSGKREFIDNLHCTSKQYVLPHMPTVIPLLTCVNIDCTSKMGGANFSTLTLYINGHDFQSGIKSVCDECKNNVFFLYLGKS
jgi:hypothetical protein